MLRVAPKGWFEDSLAAKGRQHKRSFYIPIKRDSGRHNMQFGTVLVKWQNYRITPMSSSCNLSKLTTRYKLRGAEIRTGKEYRDWGNSFALWAMRFRWIVERSELCKCRWTWCISKYGWWRTVTVGSRLVCSLWNSWTSLFSSKLVWSVNGDLRRKRMEQKLEYGVWYDLAWSVMKT